MRRRKAIRLGFIVQSVYVWRVRQELAVCQDCVFVAANGAPDYDGYFGSRHAFRYAQAVQMFGDEPFSIDDECRFSRDACEFCGDDVAGSRFVVSVMQIQAEA